MKISDILDKFKELGKPGSEEEMARLGITPEKAYGVRLPDLRKMAKEIGKDHELALELWSINTRETRILASMIDEVKKVDGKQMERYVKDFDYWEICDQVCMNLFRKLKVAWEKAVEWSERKEEFVKRAGFVLMAVMAVHEKKVADEKFERFFPIIERESTDERDRVKKAVNWALRQIGKKNLELNKKAIKVANDLLKIDSKVAKWIAKDALKELESKKIQDRFSK
ncbi:MAG: DNA alkylation repair protein [Candidatus Hodarchaeota archaeon]